MRRHGPGAGEHPQELELDERRLCLLTADLDGPAGDVDRQLADLDHFVVTALAEPSATAAGAPEHGCETHGSRTAS